MKKLYSLLLICLLGSSIMAQTGPAGKSFYVDYDQFQLDNLRRYLNCGNDASLNPGSSMTMECWVRIHDSNWNQKVFGKVTPSFNSGYMMAVEQGKCYPEVWTPSGTDSKLGFIPPTGFWYHFAVTIQPGDSMKTYVNGTFVGGVPVPGTAIANNTAPLIIGIAPWDLSNFQYFGHIDEIRIWNMVKTPADIFESLHKPLAGTETGLMAYYTFDAATASGGAADDSPNSNDCSFFQGTSDNVVDSRAVLGDAAVAASSDVHGLWNGNGFTNPRVSITQNGLSMTDTITDWDYAVFGHDNGSGVSTSDLPTGAPSGAERTDRVWTAYEEGTLSPDFSMNLDNASGGGSTLNTTYNASDYYLLYRSGTSGDFVAIQAGNSKNGNTVVFQNVNFKSGYYALAASSDPITVVGLDQELSAQQLALYPNPGSGLFRFRLGEALREAAVLHIYNVQGALVKTTPFPQGIGAEEITLDLSGVAPGPYFVELRSTNRRFVGRVIVE